LAREGVGHHLVFVFAVTQLSHSFLKALTLTGAIHVSLLFRAVWRVRIYTSCVTNWLDLGRALVRLLLFALMLAGPILSTPIPEAFEAKGLFFAPQEARLAMLLLLVPVAPVLSALTLGAATTMVLAVIAAWEWNSPRQLRILFR
jgi:low temperature requirement protein LtrA